MIKRRLGKTKLNVTVISFGALPIQRVSKKEAVEIIRKCLKEGMNFIDTARVYTDSEEKIKEAVKDIPRESFYLATKGMVTTKEELEESIKTSLEQLGMDYIDLYQIHNVNDEERLNKILNEDGAYNALLKYKERGIVKHIGVTSHNAEFSIKMIETEKFETIQIPFNFVERDALELLKKAKELDIGTIIMKPFAGGAITNGKASLKWIAKHEEVSAIIPGIDNIKQVDEAILADKENFELTEEENKKLREECEKLGKDLCRRCNYCMPCPQGINISMTYRMKVDIMNYGKDNENLRKRYNSMIPNVEACTECGICESKCPYKLPIIKTLKEVHEALKSE